MKLREIKDLPLESPVQTKASQPEMIHISNNTLESIVRLVARCPQPDKPTPEEIGEVCTKLRHLSPDISINPQVRSAIRSFWHNVPAGLARVKNAIAQGWCKQPTGLFVQTLKNGAIGDKEVVVVAKEYPRPTLEQLNQLGEMGELALLNQNMNHVIASSLRAQCARSATEPYLR